MSAHTVSRRSFAFSAAGALAAGAAERNKILIALIDGFDPEYLERSDMPNLKRLISSGVYRVGKCVLPSVTNVNNASVVTGCFPDEHGIVTNFYYDPRSGESVEMESAEFLLRPTIFERAGKAALRTALVTAKEKIKTLLSRGAHVAVAAEAPEAEFIQLVGPKPNMYSAEVNYWVFRAAHHLLRRGGIDLLYLSTTDYMMHTYAPADARSQEHLHRLDRLLGDLLSDIPNLSVLLTADHGMNPKTEGIDIARVLAAKGIEAEAVPIIRDKHVVHHQNLGGACYVYLKRRADEAKAFNVVRSVPGVEEVYRRSQAARRFHLRADRIGDLFLLAARQVAFGALPAERQEIKIRSHGSRHEQAVPILCYGPQAPKTRPEYNLDLTRHLKLL
jgi:phosphonoacetate hydrolase